MPELFKGKPGSTFELAKAGRSKVEGLHSEAEHLLRQDFFLCFGLHPLNNPSPWAANLVAGIGGLSIPLELPLTVDAGGSTQTVLGMDVVKGKSSVSGEGVTYERPVGANAKKPDSEDLEGKGFAYIPLGGPVQIGTTPEHEVTIEPGHGFLADEDQHHSVHVPAGHIAIEFVLASGTGHQASEWHRYVQAQANPYTR